MRDEMKGALMLLVGPPAVGKTLFANKLLSCSLHNYRFIHVNYDLLLKEWHPDQMLQWKEKRQNVFEMVGYLIRDLISSNESASPIFVRKITLTPAEKFVIIIDDNMYYKSMRLKYYQLAQSLKCGFCQIYFQGDVKSAIAANDMRPAPAKVPISVISNIFNKIDKPDVNNKWEKNTLFVEAFIGCDETKLLLWLTEVFNETIEAAVAPAILIPKRTASQLHLLDLTLRKFISTCINNERKKNPRGNVSDLSASLLKKKTSILLGVKNGQIFLPENDITNFVAQMFQIV